MKSEMKRIVATCRLFWNAYDQSEEPRYGMTVFDVFDESEEDVLGGT